MFTLSLAFDTKSNQMLICFDLLLSMKILRNSTCCDIKLKLCFEMLTPAPLYLRCSQTEGGDGEVICRTQTEVFTLPLISLLSASVLWDLSAKLNVDYITSNSELKQHLV